MKVTRGLSVPEVLRATKNPYSCQYLHSLVINKNKSQNKTPPIVSIIGILIDEGEDVTDLSSVTTFTSDSPKSKRK